MTGNSGWYPRADGSLYRRSRSLEQSAHMAILATDCLGRPRRLRDSRSQRDLQGRCTPSAESRRPIRILSARMGSSYTARTKGNEPGAEIGDPACNRHKQPRAYSPANRRCAARVHIDRRASGESRGYGCSQSPSALVVCRAARQHHRRAAAKATDPRFLVRTDGSSS